MPRSSTTRLGRAGLAAAAAVFVLPTAVSAQTFPPPGGSCLGQTVEFAGTAHADTIVVGTRSVTRVSANKTSATHRFRRGTTSLVIATYGGNDSVSIEADIDVTLCTGTGSDDVTATAGEHHVRSDGTATVSLADGNDVTRIKGTATSVSTGGGNDVTIIGNWATPDSVDGGAGDDLIIIENDATADSVVGGGGDDLIIVESRAAADSVVGGSGDDVIMIERDATADSVAGGSGDDEIEVEVRGTR